MISYKKPFKDVWEAAMTTAGANLGSGDTIDDDDVRVPSGKVISPPADRVGDSNGGT